jgi:ribosomal protein S13
MTTSVLFHTLPAAEAYARGEGVIHGIDDRLGDIIGYRVEIEETERIKRLELEETERIKRLVLDDAQLRLENDRSLHTEVLYGTLAKSVALGMEQTDHPRTRVIEKVAAKFGVSVRTVERAIAEERKRLAALRRPPTATL